jgi:hypothetical protein
MSCFSKYTSSYVHVDCITGEDTHIKNLQFRTAVNSEERRNKHALQSDAERRIQEEKIGFLTGGEGGGGFGTENGHKNSLPLTSEPNSRTIPSLVVKFNSKPSSSLSVSGCTRLSALFLTGIVTPFNENDSRNLFRVNGSKIFL